MKTSPLDLKLTDWLLLILLSFLWGGSFFFMKVAVQELPVFTVVVGRVGLATLLMTGFVYLRGFRLPDSVQMWGSFILLGILRAALPISLFVWAETKIDSNLAGILNSTTPLFTAIVAHFLTPDEPLSPNRIFGILLGMAGVIFLMGPSALAGLGQEFLAQVAILGATCSYGFAGVYGRCFKAVPIPVSTAGMLIGATVLIAPLALILEQPWTLRPGLFSLGAVFGLALLSTAIAFMVWFQLILRVGATNSSLVTFLIPITALGLGVFVLGEQIGWSSYVGLALILLGLGVAQKHLFIPKRYYMLERSNP